MLDKLNADLKTAMLARDQQTVEVLRYLKSALQSEQINTQQELTDEAAMQVLRREAKKRQEAIELYDKAGDSERAGKERFEVEVISRYLPQAMGEDEVKALVNQVMSEQGDAPNQGQVIQEVIKRAEGRAEGRLVAQLVRERLTQ